MSITIKELRTQLSMFKDDLPVFFDADDGIIRPIDGTGMARLVDGRVVQWDEDIGAKESSPCILICES